MADIVTIEEIKEHLEALDGIVIPQSGIRFLNTFKQKAEKLVCQFLQYNPASQLGIVEYQPNGPVNTWFDGDELISNYDIVGNQAMPRMRGDRSRAAILLSQVPVRAITEIREDPSAQLRGVVGGDFPAASILPTTAYSLDMRNNGISRTGIVWRSSGLWSVTPRTIRITYDAGLSPAELAGEFSPIKEAILVACVEWFVLMVNRSRAGKVGGIFAQVAIKDFSLTMAPIMQQIAGFALPPAALQMLEPFVNYANYF